MRRKKGRPPPVRGWKSPRGIVCPCESPRRLLHSPEQRMDFNSIDVSHACVGQMSQEKFLSDELFYQKNFKNPTSQIEYHSEILYFSILFQIV